LQAIECSLDGITPISEDGWSREAKRYFKDILMENQMILAEIKDVAGTVKSIIILLTDLSMCLPKYVRNFYDN